MKQHFVLNYTVESTGIHKPIKGTVAREKSWTPALFVSKKSASRAAVCCVFLHINRLLVLTDI